LTDISRPKAYNTFGLDPSKQTLLILGGSGGARSINDALSQDIAGLQNHLQPQIVLQSRQRYYDGIRRDTDPEDYVHPLLTDFLHDMPAAYAVADLVVSRAGALSCAELALTGKPSILVPSPNVAGDHQTKNARSMVDEGAAELAEDHQLSQTLTALVEK